MSIQAEIDRINSAKQTLMRWLSEHQIILNINATIDELVELLDTVSTEGSTEVSLVSVTVSNNAAATIVKTVFPEGTQQAGLTLVTGNKYLCPANSLFVLYGTCTGGTTSTTAYPAVTLDGDLTSETVYVTYSNSTTTKPIGIYAIHIGSEGGTVTLTRKTTNGVLM